MEKCARLKGGSVASSAPTFPPPALIAEFCGRVRVRTQDITVAVLTRFTPPPRGPAHVPAVSGKIQWEGRNPLRILSSGEQSADLPRVHRRRYLEGPVVSRPAPTPLQTIRRSVVDCLGEHPETHSFRDLPRVHRRRYLRGPIVCQTHRPLPRKVPDGLTNF